MSRDLTGQKKLDPETVLAAIKALQEKGWDINPYTVADEAKIPRSTLYRSTELMSIVSQYSSEVSAAGAAPEGSVRVSELEARIAELETEIAKLKAINERLEKGEQEAWQAGYNAALYEQNKQSGQHDAPDTTGGAQLAEQAVEQEQAPKQADFEPHAALSSPESAAAADFNDSPYEGQEAYIRFEEAPSGQAYIDERAAAQKAEHSTGDHATQAAWDAPESDAVASHEGNAEELQWGAPEGHAEVSGNHSAGWGAPPGGQDLEPVDLPPDYYMAEPTDAAAASEQAGSWGAPLEGEASDTGEAAGSAATGGEEPEGDIDYDSDRDEALDPRWKSSTLTEDDLRDLLKHRFKQEEAQPEKKEDEGARKVAGTRFVGGHKAPQEPPAPGQTVRVVPPDIRKACLVLGLRPEEITLEKVHKAWKLEMTREHPDIGGDTEIAVYLNGAKETLSRWLEAQAPKLGKKFGQATMQFRRPTEPEDKDADKANNK
jgi:hypothetical protein